VSVWSLLLGISTTDEPKQKTDKDSQMTALVRLPFVGSLYVTTRTVSNRVRHRTIVLVAGHAFYVERQDRHVQRLHDLALRVVERARVQRVQPGASLDLGHRTIIVCGDGLS
jgi:hypothetical protein